MDIIQERLEREYGLDLIFTAPTVVYKVIPVKGGGELLIENPSKLPELTAIERIDEPYVRMTVHTPETYVGSILKLLNERRGMQVSLDYVSQKKICLVYEIPMNEMIYDFHDKLKSISKGYASMDYELIDYREGDLVKLIFLSMVRQSTPCLVSCTGRTQIHGVEVYAQS